MTKQKDATMTKLRNDISLLNTAVHYFLSELNGKHPTCLQVEESLKNEKLCILSAYNYCFFVCKGNIPSQGLFDLISKNPELLKHFN